MSANGFFKVSGVLLHKSTSNRSGFLVRLGEMNLEKLS